MNGRRAMKFSSITIFAVLIFSPLSANAETLIHAEYTATYDRLRPNPYKGIYLNNKYDVTLTDKNTVEETNTRAAGKFSDSKTSSTKLGSGGWEVLADNKLKRTFDQPQSTLEMTIAVEGSTCKLDVQFKLKPGFKEFAFKKIMDGKIGFFTQPQVQSTSCSIK
jgi:hypothetical protein